MEVYSIGFVCVLYGAWRLWREICTLGGAFHLSTKLQVMYFRTAMLDRDAESGKCPKARLEEFEFQGALVFLDRLTLRCAQGHSAL